MPLLPSSKTDQRDLFRGALEMMILRLVMREPMHGYALVQQIRQRSQDLVLVEEGSLYPALQRLLKEGLLVAKWEISASNRRVRTYRITAAGKKHLEREMFSLERMLKGVALVLSPAES
jgi:PadR family transcriptional regulator, regulatory protein PadR